MSIQKYQYKGNSITFEVGGETYINATEMAKPFGKRVHDFLRLKTTKEYLEVLKSDAVIPVSLARGNYSDGREQGTWMHELLAIEFAGWLSPEFKLWSHKKIREILKSPVQTGHALSPATDPHLLNRIMRLEQKMEALALPSAGDPGIYEDSGETYYSIRQYAMWYSISIPHGTASKLGRLCNTICKQRGLPVKDIPDKRYGFVGGYPESIIHSAVNELGLT